MASEDARGYVERLRRLYAAVVGDVLDAEGFREQVMAHTLRPLAPEMAVCGIARTVLCVPVFAASGEPYAEEIRAVDSLQPLEVLVATTGGVTTASFWGELLSTAAVARGAAGAVVDGFTRDVKRIPATRFTPYSTLPLVHPCLSGNHGSSFRAPKAFHGPGHLTVTVPLNNLTRLVPATVY